MKTKITATLSALLIFSLLFSTGCSKKNEQTDDPTTTEAFLQDDLTDNADTPAPEENESQSSTTLPEEGTSAVSQDDTSTTTAVDTAPKTTEETVEAPVVDEAPAAEEAPVEAKAEEAAATPAE